MHRLGARRLHPTLLLQCVLLFNLATSYCFLQNRLQQRPACILQRTAVQGTADKDYDQYLQQPVLPASSAVGNRDWLGLAKAKHFLAENSGKIRKLLAISMMVPMLAVGRMAGADDELAKYAADGNAVGVDGQCFFKKCAIETSRCANDPSCLKGLSCLARCKGGSLCSTGCFAKYGSPNLDNILSCSVEKNDCVHVPGKESVGWKMDSLEDLPTKPLANFDLKTLDGKWYKVMGLDSRYDCFDCQKNSFKVKDKNTLKMEAVFRIPRPTDPGYLQNRIEEELHATTAEDGRIAHLQSKGEMFGLTFWENWYVLADSTLMSSVKSKGVDMKLIYYTGHTLQGNYKGAFLYSRSSEMTPELINVGAEVIRQAGLDPNEFCVIRNQCFQKGANKKTNGVASGEDSQMTISDGRSKQGTYWYLGENFFQASKVVAQELADWFQDPAIVSDWLVQQQERMVFTQPLEVSPFASIPSDR